MPHCPKCNQLVDAQAIACPRCQEALKAFGHPGIPLHRASSEEFLCDTCIYHADDTCTFPQRPFAKKCTLYSANNPQNQLSPSYSLGWHHTFSLWCKRHQGLLMVLGLGAVSFLITVLAINR